jgi:hypothetical protein
VDVAIGAANVVSTVTKEVQGNPALIRLSDLALGGSKLGALPPVDRPGAPQPEAA